MNMNITDRVLAHLAQEEIHPLPRWIFRLRAAAFWAVWTVAALLGALVVSVALFRLFSAGWAFRAATHDSSARFFFQAMPLAWLAVFLLVVCAAYRLFRQTPHGYRYSFYGAVGSSVVVSVVLGGVLYAQGAGKRADEFAGRAVPFYEPLERQQRHLWVNPPRGLLAGDVVSANQVTIIVHDFTGDDWTVDGAALTTYEFAVAQPGMRVRVLGVPTRGPAHEMRACLLLPWEAPLPSRPMPMDERNGMGMRSNPCKGLAPYEALQLLRSP